MSDYFDIDTFYIVIRWVFLIYILHITAFYLIGSLYSIYVNILYRDKHDLTDYDSIGLSPYSPGISIIAPAYNESLTIVDNIRSLLSLDYPKKEVIVVNDGSKDDTIPKLIEHFDLYRVNIDRTANLHSKAVKNVYKSKNKALGALLIIDKENGGKSDALNAGVNYSNYPIIGCMDVDSILLKDSLQKLVKPFLDSTEVIATGGAVRIANACEIEHGHLTNVRMPHKWIERFQVLEYLRAFLVGRMVWSAINSLLLVSGAVGLFKKSLVIEVGGYRTDVVGEDLELVIHMRRHMYEQNRPHKVVYVPDPVCWTEAPSDGKVLGRQRNRWNRGALEGLMIHSKMLFNPKYGRVGMLSLPYWFLFEWMGPIIEGVGVVLMLVMMGLGYFSVSEFLVLTFLAYAFALLISTITIFIEEITFQRYTRKMDVFKLFLTALIEPIFYHPRILWWSLTGTWDKVMGTSKGWGAMTRKGFVQEKSRTP